LIAAGDFTIAGGAAAQRIASWDGSSWSPLGSGLDGDVDALTVYDNKLIAGGSFLVAGGVIAKNIAAWDGSSWSPLGSGLEDIVPMALAEYDSKLYAAGNGMASWDGNTWSPFGHEVTDWVYTLTVYDNRLIAGGSFRFPSGDGTIANYIAAWDGHSWSSLGSGTNGTVRALGAYHDYLMAGGEFTMAGGKASAYVAVWTQRGLVDVGDDPAGLQPQDYVLGQNYPNPFNPATVIEYAVPQRSHVTIVVINVLGQTIRTLVDEEKSAGSYRVIWNGTDQSGQSVSTGVYLYRFQAGDYTLSKKMLLVR
jgi:hypothetical protein